MVRAERNNPRARAWILDERDHAIFLSLLEHKVLTTQQIKSLYFRSLRRCQHRLKELRDLALIASFTPGSGFGEGRPPACWFLTKTGLSACAEAKDVRASDLSWIPDSSYKESQNLAHRLGVNAFFCASSRPPGLTRATVSSPGDRSTGFEPEPPRSSPTGSGATCIRVERASSTWSTTGAPRRSARCRESSRVTSGSRRDGRRSRRSSGSRISSSSFRRGCARGRSAQRFATRSGAYTSADRSRPRSRCTWRARRGSPSPECSGPSGCTYPRTAIACRSSTCRPGLGTSTDLLLASAATSPMPAHGVASPQCRRRPDSWRCRPDMPLEAAARGRANTRSRAPPPAAQARQGLGRRPQRAEGRCRLRCRAGRRVRRRC